MSTTPALASPPENSSIALNDVTLVRGTTTIFDKLSLELTEARIGLIGDNGSGKSSLFRMACGLDAPHTGTVTVQGLNAFRINAQRPNLVGMMFQNPDDQIVFPTVQEELALGLTATGMPRRDAIAQARGIETSWGMLPAACDLAA